MKQHKPLPYSIIRKLHYLITQATHSQLRIGRTLEDIHTKLMNCSSTLLDITGELHTTIERILK